MCPRSSFDANAIARSRRIRRRGKPRRRSHEMPVIGDLNASGNASRSLHRSYRPGRMRRFRYPGDRQARSQRWQHGRARASRSAAAPIADDRALAMAAAVGAVVDAATFRRDLFVNRPVAAPFAAVCHAHPNHEPLCKTCRRPAAEHQSKVMNDALKSGSAERSLGGTAVVKTFSEDRPRQCRIADEAAGDEVEFFVPVHRRSDTRRR